MIQAIMLCGAFAVVGIFFGIPLWVHWIKVIWEFWF